MIDAGRDAVQGKDAVQGSCKGGEEVQKVKPLSTQGLRPVNLIDLLGK